MDYIRLGKEITYALRPAPWEYELEMDDKGFVDIEQLLSAINEGSKYSKTIDKSDITKVMEVSNKKRLEIVGEKIRAMYGHSFSRQIKYQEGQPPAILYHGTAKRFLNSIKKEGLKPMSRQYVHLSEDIETAKMVGKRRDFDKANDKVWLCKKLPPQFIK